MVRQFINYLKLYRHLSEDEQQLLADNFEYRSVTEGDYLFRSGHTCKELFFICKGILKIVLQNEKGKEVTCFFLKENQFCTILNSFNNRVPADEDIQAACDAEVLAISKTRLIALYEKLPYLKGLINEIIQQALLDKIQTRNAYLGLNAVTRYRLFMMRQPDIALRVPLNDIASYLGITPQSLSRIRKNIG